MASIDFIKGFTEYVKAHQKIWKHDRSKSLGASEVFGCLRKAWFNKHGVEKDPDYKDSWGALQRGDVIENYFVEPAVRWFLENLHGETKLIWGGKKQRTLIQGKLSATPDGLVIGAADDALAAYGVASLGGTGCFNFEIKSIDPRVNLKEEKMIHRGQVQVQMGLTRKLTRYKPNYAVICYVDASFFDDIDVFVVPFDKKAFDSAVARANDVFTIKDPIEIMPEGKIDGACEHCQFKRACARTNEIHMPQEGVANEKNTSLAIMDEFDAIVQRERVANAEKKAAEAEHKRYSEELKQWFRETGVRRAVSSEAGIQASISWVKGRKTYDIDAMSADGIDVEKYAVTGEGHERLTISEKGGQKADD